MCEGCKIPISFEYIGKQYSGYFEAVNGAGANVWHLNVGGYHYGQLIYSDKYGWAYYGNKPGMEQMANYFGDCVISWYE